MNKKVVTFCVYGKNPKYSSGIINAVKSAIKFYIDWEIWVYTCNEGELSVPEETIQELNKLECKVIKYKNFSQGATCEGMFRRFTPFDDESVDYWLCRDADSRCSLREKTMVDEWISSKKTLHTILDNGCHKDIMGCSFGVCNINLRMKYPEKIININDYLYDFVIVKKRVITKYGDDQVWIRNFLKSIFTGKNDLYAHIPEHLENTMTVYGQNTKSKKFDYTITQKTNDFVGKPVNWQQG